MDICYLHRAVPSVVETAAVLGLKSWVWMAEHDFGQVQGPGTELLGCVCGAQHDVQYYCYVHVRVHLCFEAL